MNSSAVNTAPTKATSTRRVRCGVIGCGAISKPHLEYLAKSERVDLVGVCDLSPVTAEHAAAVAGTRAFTDMHAMLAEGIDIVHVLTPPSTHEPISIAALEAGANVICEKPVAPDRAALDRMLASAAANDRWLVEGHNLRWNDPVVWLRSLAADGTLGDVLAVEVLLALPVASEGSRFADTNLPSPVRNLPGGVVQDFLPHLAYLALEPVGFGAATNVTAAWANHSGNATLVYDEVDASAQVGSASIRTRFSARTHPDHFRVIIRGSKATAEVDLYREYRRLERLDGPKLLATLLEYTRNGLSMAAAGAKDLSNKVMQHSPYHGIGRMLDEIYGATQRGDAPPITVDEMRACVDLIDAIIAAAPGSGASSNAAPGAIATEVKA